MTNFQSCLPTNKRTKWKIIYRERVFNLNNLLLPSFSPSVSELNASGECGSAYDFRLMGLSESAVRLSSRANADLVDIMWRNLYDLTRVVINEDMHAGSLNLSTSIWRFLPLSRCRCKYLRLPPCCGLCKLRENVDCPVCACGCFSAPFFGHSDLFFDKKIIVQTAVG